MKPQILLAGKMAGLWLLPVFSFTQTEAQCNINDKYDKIISGYHSSIALKDNGVYAVWGSFMSSTGAADVLAPQDLNSTNYSGLTGSILKVALGGRNAGSQVDQAILLTTTGLWAWGVEGNVLNTSLTTSAAFQRISSPSGANSYGLPTGVNPADVSALIASYQTLYLLTTGGNVWIITQASLAIEANGGVVTTAGSSVWKEIKLDASTNLSGVIAVRGQVSSGTYNAFVALTSGGQVYTWGNTTYLGNNSASAARNYATLMTLPAEFSSSVPKMIGVTGGIGTTATTKNTYFLLSNAGNLYALGDNTQKQCGDFTTTERTGWVNAKINVSTNFSNISFISPQEHNSSYPGIVAITANGDLYTWGNNSSSMLGRTDNGTAGGTVGATYDPGLPVGFTSGTDIAISAELGGHTLLYLREGTSQFCYVGHRTNGSMGDGTATSSTNGAFFASCSITPVLNICGYVPVAASTANSTISAAQSAIQADGSSTTIITVQLKDGAGTNLTSSGGTIVISTISGTIGTVTDNNNGTYTALLTSAASPGSTTLTFTINGTAGSHNASVSFTTALPLTWIHIQAYRLNKSVRIKWSTSFEVNVSHFDIERSMNGQDWNIIIPSIPAINQNGINDYEQTDSNWNPRPLYYRISQWDADGYHNFSRVQMVPALTRADKITVFPVPAGNIFHLGTSSPELIKKVQMLTVNGSVMKSWTLYQPSFDIQEIPPGIYLLRVETSEGEIQNLRINKF